MGCFGKFSLLSPPHPWRVSSFNCTVCINLLPFIADTHSPDVNELPDNENSIGDTHAANVRKNWENHREKIATREIFKHLLSLDIAAVSFINFIASAVQAFLFSVRILCCINYVIAVELLNQLVHENTREICITGFKTVRISDMNELRALIHWLFDLQKINVRLFAFAPATANYLKLCNIWERLHLHNPCIPETTTFRYRLPYPLDEQHVARSVEANSMRILPSRWQFEGKSSFLLRRACVGGLCRRVSEFSPRSPFRGSTDFVHASISMSNSKALQMFTDP